MRLVAGSRLDSYEIILPLGAGGMGEVYRARDTSLKRDVAIKVLPDQWSTDLGRLHRFELEAQATQATTQLFAAYGHAPPQIVEEILDEHDLVFGLRH